MILGVGTDIVEVARFKAWAQYPPTRLLKIFSEQELAGCYDDNHQLIAEKLAARFAAKEAFYKALSASLVSLKKADKTFSFLSIVRYVAVVYGEWGVPLFLVDWDALNKHTGNEISNFRLHLSLAHEKLHALAFVVMSC